jgi:Tfp pilus assembly protein FimT
LIELVIAIAIVMLMLLIAVPSITGVMADRRLRRSLDSFNGLVHQAQERSLAEHRPYLLVLAKDRVELRPEVLLKEDDPKPVAEFQIGRNEALKLSLPAALIKNPPPEWIFWPTGTCEPAVVQFTGREGTWTANYAALSARAQLTKYVVR